MDVRERQLHADDGERATRRATPVQAALEYKGRVRLRLRYARRAEDGRPLVGERARPEISQPCEHHLSAAR